MRRILGILAVCLMVAGCACFQRPRTYADYARDYCLSYPHSCSPSVAVVGAAAGALIPAASDDVPFLPWPPPEPSAMLDLTPQVSMKGRFAEIARRLEGRLTSKGYDKLLYYEVPGGFAITTELERFDEAGHPIDHGRFVEGKVGGWNGWGDYLKRLIAGEQGRFRLFVFVVTSEPFAPGRFPATQTDVERWETSGAFSLSHELAAKLAPRGTRTRLLIYEFEANRGRAAGIRQARDRVPSAKHLAWLEFIR